MIIGSHVSFASDQLLGSAKEADSYNANTFMFYTGAPQNTIRKEIDNVKTNEALNFMKSKGIDIKNVVCHAPYIINLANRENEAAWNFSIAFLKEEVRRMNKMGVNKMVVHPGNSLKIDRGEALKNIADALNFILSEDSNVTILLETMAGKGTECGINIGEISDIIDRVEYKDMVAVCLDTCHLNDSGIDIHLFQEYLEEFDKVIGIDKIKCIHVNDSKNIRGSRKDRHENIGYGTIGFDNLINVLYNEKLKDVPKILETPYIEGCPPYKFEIDMIRSKKFNENLHSDVIGYYKK